MIDDTDIERLTLAASKLTATPSSYLEEDFVTNLFVTVLDYQLQTPVVGKALEHFRVSHAAASRSARSRARWPPPDA